ncbi:hypothetical protein JX580_05190 [Thiomicrospira microaerophila]|uniref:hypothetical protein n=1 Tax=Thiomicrospira microaerophila TaxID=406020 RepID=UPI00200FB38E|nr:hypothetical protein [Thiomicrospira microaerophila]UQB43272.1 hypothetical protein JX580_05190 [Thiomicrospira microaerophila]
MMALFCQQPQHHHIYRKKQMSLEAIKEEAKRIKTRLIDSFALNTEADYIISGEGLIRLSTVELQEMKAFFSQYFDRFFICGYVREPISYMESDFQQRIKGGLDRFVIHGPQYHNRFEKFDQVFGKEALHLWLFNPKDFMNNCVVQDFCNRLGVEIKPEQVVVSNDGLSFPAVSLLYTARRYGFDYGVGTRMMLANQRMIALLKQLKGPKLRFSGALVDSLWSEHQEDIDWIILRTGFEFKKPTNACRDCSISSEEDLLTINPLVLAEWMGLVRDELAKQKNASAKQKNASAFPVSSVELVWKPHSLSMLFTIARLEKSAGGCYWQVFRKTAARLKRRGWASAYSSLCIEYNLVLNGHVKQLIESR